MMEKFSRFLRKNEIQHTYWRKHKQIEIREAGYKLTFHTDGKGYWTVAKNDPASKLGRLSIAFPCNSIESMMKKIMRYNLIPYQYLSKIKL